MVIRLRRSAGRDYAESHAFLACDITYQIYTMRQGRYEPCVNVRHHNPHTQKYYYILNNQIEFIKWHI